MKKKLIHGISRDREMVHKIWLTMRLFVFLFFVSLLHVSASVYSQKTKLNLKVDNATLQQVFKAIQDQSEFDFFYKNEQIPSDTRVSIEFRNEPVEVVLNNVLQGTGLGYHVLDKDIVISTNVNPNNEAGQQQRSVNGKVTDSTGGSLPGVSVVVKGTAIGVITDMDGKFSISKVPENAILVFSFVGMKAQEISVGNKTTINAVLTEESIGIEEVVAVGYGTAKKRDIIGSVASVNMEELKVKGTATFDAGLQGLSSGVSVQSQSGVPGAPSIIKIRGLGSVNSGTDPLWIIDGMPVLSWDVAQNQGTTSQSPMSLINSNDIENIQVLKDAAATAIYGSRASNGVIIITTKSGKKGNGGLSIDYATGVSDLTRKPSDIGYANTSQWFSVMDKMYQNSGKTFDLNEYYRLMPYAFEKLTRSQAMANNTNWYDQLFQKGSFQDINLSTSKNTDKSNYFVSLNYRKDEGVQRFNSLERYSGRTSLDINPLENLTMGIKMNFSYSKNNRMQNTGYRGGAGTNGGLNAITTSAMPWYPIYSLANPQKYFNPYGGSNPLAYADPANLKDELEQFRTLGGIFAEYKFPFIKGLSVRSEFAFDILQSNSNLWKSSEVNLDASNKANSFASDQTVSRKSVNYNAYVTYDKAFNAHNINLVVGTEAQRSNQVNHQAIGQDLVGKFQELGTPATMLSISAGLIGERYILSYFGRANYKYKDRYMLGLSMRRDGSSAFIAENRWGNFLAVSAGWILSDETFMSFIGKRNFLKLRGSYGETGNQSIPGGLDQTNYEGPYMMYGGTSIMGVNGTLPVNIAVSNLTWETTKSSDIGIDFGLLGNRINGSVAYYHKYVENMLLQGPIPVSAGVGGNPYVENTNSIWGNIGDMTNSGFEFDIHSTNIQNKSFRWTTDFNISFNKNEIKKLTPEADQTGKGLITETTVSRKGHKRLEWYLADYAGVDAQTGIPMVYVLDQASYDKTGETIRLKNIGGKDSLTYATQSNIQSNRFYQNGKSADPTYYGGITNTFQYKGFDFSFLVSFSGGNYIYDYDEQMATTPSPGRIFKTDIINNSWEKPGDVAKYPKLTADASYLINGKTVSGFSNDWVYYNRCLYKGDYIRLRNLQLGYNFPTHIINTLKLSSLRLYVMGTNLWTKTGYKGFDPEGSGNIYTAIIPQLKSLIFGLNVKF